MTVLSPQEIDKRLDSYEAWTLDEETGKLLAGFEFEDFDQTMDFINSIAEIANLVAHHPDILLHEGRFVTIFTSTHSAGGITEKDFELIEAIEKDIQHSQEHTHE